MEETGTRKALCIAVGIAGVILGAAAGYFYGVSAGTAQGRSQVLAEQAQVEEARLLEIQKAANPYSQAKDAANPFKDVYTNPFAQ